ncbi:uncharacterized protein [Ptychodera flava]|uniref:uncharacterized protein n=1 Tax=Ptychodera flava TaxID=63121 RepID=UPI00396A568A
MASKSVDELRRVPINEQHCSLYLNGICNSSDCQSPHTLIGDFSASNWSTTHMNVLNIRAVELADYDELSDDLDRYLCEWLVGFPTNFEVDNPLPCQSDLSPSTKKIINSATEKSRLALLSTHESIVTSDELKKGRLKMIDDCESLDDTFLYLWRQFHPNVSRCQKERLEEVAQKTVVKLRKSSRATKPEDEIKVLNHTNTLLTWTEAKKLEDSIQGDGPNHRQQHLRPSESSMDDLLADIIRSAATETKCNAKIRIRDSRKRRVKICGQDHCAVSNVEVTAMSDVGTTLQFIVLTEKSCEVADHICRNNVIAQLSRECLTIARESIFGDNDFKIVYLVSILKKDHKYQLFLARAHIASSTLDAMECQCKGDCTCSWPIHNPLQPSYVFYSSVPNSDLFTGSGIECLYQAIKVICMFFLAVSRKLAKLK